MPVISKIKSELHIYRCEKCGAEFPFTLTNLDNSMLFFHRDNRGAICDGWLNVAEIWTDREQWQKILDVQF